MRSPRRFARPAIAAMSGVVTAKTRPRWRFSSPTCRRSGGARITANHRQAMTALAMPARRPLMNAEATTKVRTMAGGFGTRIPSAVNVSIRMTSPRTRAGPAIFGNASVV